jgi:hypothetical protein
MRVDESWRSNVKGRYNKFEATIPLPASAYISRQQTRCMAIMEKVASREQIRLEENGLYNSRQLIPFWLGHLGLNNREFQPRHRTMAFAGLINFGLACIW